MKRIVSAAWAAVLVATVLGCSRQAVTTLPMVEGKAAREFATELRRAVTVDAMVGHLAELQEIADANGGTRAVGTPGFDASVDYVAGVLRDSGFDVQTPEFQTKVFKHGDPVLTAGGVGVEAGVLKFSGGTPAAGVSGPLIAAPADDSPGCSPADFDGLPVNGAVVVVDRGSCPFSQKQAIAAKLGAVAVVIANNDEEGNFGGTLGEHADVRIPVLSVSKADGAELRAVQGPATIKLQASTTVVSARNVIAQTRSGSPRNVVLAGGHLDSVADGPGINDNGSGVAALLETAVQLGSSPAVTNAVRFGFWGAEEVGIVGSKRYVASLDVDQLKDIALYLNFDMIGSPNPGYFTYDGDQSTELDPDESPPRVPEGAAGIERTFVEYLKSAGKPAEDTAFDGRSDYDGFTMAGIPAGGLFSGAEEDKSPDQARLWGGVGNQPFDPNYHRDTDTLDQVDRTALAINGGGVAWAIGVYATDLDGRNGIPAREDRTRHEIADG